jgi:pectin lyase
MKSYIFGNLLAFLGRAAAVGVVGTAPGFAASTTGGGSATPQYPADITVLKAWLTDSAARVRVQLPPARPYLQSIRYNFIGSEGIVTETGCRPASNTCPGTADKMLSIMLTGELHL